MVTEQKKTGRAGNKNATTEDGRYIEGIGRRKSASARVRITPAKTTAIEVNGKPMTDYFHNEKTQKIVQSIMETEESSWGDYTISVRVSGGGLSAQAEAIRLGIARALVKENIERRSILKPLHFLKRDPRSVERKKFGLRKARRRPQWSKR